MDAVTPIQDDPRPYLVCLACGLIVLGSRPGCACTGLRTVASEETVRRLTRGQLELALEV